MGLQDTTKTRSEKTGPFNGRLGMALIESLDGGIRLNAEVEFLVAVRRGGIPVPGSLKELLAADTFGEIL